MATRVKESAVIKGKEKKGTIMSSSLATQHKRNTNTTTSTSTSTSKPNYLKSTATSSVADLHKPSPASRRKSLDRPPSHRNLQADNSKPSLGRRKSFDRPQQASTTSLRSPNKPTLPRTKSTFDKPTPKSNIAPKGKMMVRSVSAVGRSSPIAKSKSPNSTRKQNDSSPRPTTIKKRQETIITANHEPEDVITNNITPNPTELMSNNNKSVVDKQPIIAAEDDEEVEDLKSFDHSSLSFPEDPNVDTNIIEELGVAEVASVQCEESDEIENNPHVEDNEGESNSKNVKETFAVVDTKFDGDEEEGSGNGDGDEKIVVISCDHNCIDEKEEEEEREKEKEKEELGDEEEVNKESCENNKKVVAEVKVVGAGVVVGAKKNESVVSNDVIEETASKLREQRKNKVKALAGAFETVISLQEPK